MNTFIKEVAIVKGCVVEGVQLETQRGCDGWRKMRLEILIKDRTEPAGALYDELHNGCDELILMTKRTYDFITQPATTVLTANDAVVVKEFNRKGKY